MFDAEAARKLAEDKKPKYMIDAEVKLPLILEAIKDAASCGNMEYVIDLTSDVKSYYPNYQYWYLQHDPFRIYLIRLLRSRGFTVKHHTNYGTSWAIIAVTVTLRISWWKKDNKKTTELWCGCCNNTFCAKV